MKSVISTTFDDKYLFFLPIVCWTWNKLGVEVICFKPYANSDSDIAKTELAIKTIDGFKGSYWVLTFDAPEHKQATYAQCSRLFAGCLNMPDDEILITSDIDMMVFRLPPVPKKTHDFTVFGSDLVPQGQYPICYVAGEKITWEAFFRCYKTLQVCLDELLGDIECENFRGNYWSKDQEHLFNTLAVAKVEHVERARPGTQFSSLRYDRDDAFLLDRLSPDTVDYHMNRPGFEDKNFEIILQVLQYHYPNESFEWLVAYKNEYSSLVNQTT